MQFDLARFVRETKSSARDYGSPLGTSLYVIECPGHVKIGLSGIPEQRMAELQVGNPHRLRIAASYRFQSRTAAYVAEKGAHMMLRDHAAAGEWFAVTAVEVSGILDLVAFHAAALTRLRQMAESRRDREYDERYATDPAFRAAQDARHANWVTISATKRANRVWRQRRAA